MAGMAVYLNRAPHNVRLVRWGLADDGWWGCVTWSQRVHTAAGDGELAFAAWVPAGSLTRPSWSVPEDVPRQQLPAQRQGWPPPPGWPAWFAGVWADGPLPAPPGTQLVSGPAWRARRS